MSSLSIIYYINRPSLRILIPLPPNILISGYNIQKISSILTLDLSLPITATAAAIVIDSVAPIFFPATLFLIKTLKLENCYRPYKQDSTSTKRRLVLGQNQCAGCRTDKTSRTIRRGVAESCSYIYTERTHVFTYLRTHVLTYSCTYVLNVLTYQYTQPLLQEELYI